MWRDANMTCEALIAAVHVRKALWDPTDPLHRNVVYLKQQWEDVGRELNISVLAARKKWKNMRDYYRQELKKMDKNEIFTSTWNCFPLMSFLKGIVRPGHAKSDARMEDSHSITMVYLDETDNVDTQFSVKSNESLSSQSPSHISFIDHLPSTSTEDIYQKLPLQEGSTHRTDEEFLAIEKRKLEILEMQIKEKNDDDLLFFKSLIPHMKTLSPRRKLYVRTQIMNMLLKEIQDVSQGPIAPPPKKAKTLTVEVESIIPD